MRDIKKWQFVMRLLMVLAGPTYLCWFKPDLINGHIFINFFLLLIRKKKLVWDMLGHEKRLKINKRCKNLIDAKVTKGLCLYLLY